MKATIERAVKNHARRLILAATIALAASGVARANDDDDRWRVCSDTTLRGLYAFSASGFNIVGGAAQPKAIIELIRFNGDGTLTVPAATVSINGVITQTPPPGQPPGVGTYSVGPDCTGSLQFGPPGPAFDLFVGLKGAALHLIQVNAGTVFQGTAERVSR
jgi:hypothetical protein